MRLSRKLKGYQGGNPFNDSQARYYTDDRLIEEFFPTSFFLSLFNQQNEILLGTRGSGKTALLRMLSYSHLKKIQNKISDSLIKEAVNSNSYLGFYIPLHLEFMASLKGAGIPYENWCEYFMFAFNCLAADSFLTLISSIMNDINVDLQDKVVMEIAIVDSLCELWLKNKSNNVRLISELKWKIKVEFDKEPFWMDGESTDLHPLARPILVPIANVIERVSDILRLENNSYWIACIDEAEFLSEPFIKCINTFLRSKQNPLIVKMATLPYKHSTRETTVKGISIEPSGNDFNYRKVDLEPNSKDFENLTNNICKVRLKKSGIEVDCLEDFVGKVGNDEGIDYFKTDLKINKQDEQFRDWILREILSSLSPERKKRYLMIRTNKDKVNSQYLKKFSPVYYVRRMKIENSRANRTPGWFAGSRVIRQVADGNPRRFIQLMNDIVQTAIRSDLSPRKQHKTISGFCERIFEDSSGLPAFGPMTKNLLDVIGNILKERVHGQNMIDSGCSFIVNKNLYDQISIKKAIELGVAYSYIITDNYYADISQSKNLRLSFLCAVVFWLPMRNGSPAMIKPQNMNIDDQDCENITPSASIKYINKLQLSLFGASNE